MTCKTLGYQSLSDKCTREGCKNPRWEVTVGVRSKLCQPCYIDYIKWVFEFVNEERDSLMSIWLKEVESKGSIYTHPDRIGN